jgi:hypothetical protein
MRPLSATTLNSSVPANPHYNIWRVQIRGKFVLVPKNHVMDAYRCYEDTCSQTSNDIRLWFRNGSCCISELRTTVIIYCTPLLHFWYRCKLWLQIMNCWKYLWYCDMLTVLFNKKSHPMLGNSQVNIFQRQQTRDATTENCWKQSLIFGPPRVYIASTN